MRFGFSELLSVFYGLIFIGLIAIVFLFSGCTKINNIPTSRVNINDFRDCPKLNIINYTSFETDSGYIAYFATKTDIHPQICIDRKKLNKGIKK